MQNNSETILITGGVGFIGINLALELSKELENKIIIIDNFSSGKKNFKFNNKNIFVVRGNLQDKDTLEAAFQFKPKTVYHLAALFANQNSVDHPVEDLKSNGEATVKLLEYCVKFNVNKILYTSSSCVYGNLDNMNEEYVGELDTPYAITKLLGEQYLKYFSTYYGIKSIIIRVFNTYGNYDYPGKYRNVIPNFFNACFQNHDLIVYGDGNATRSYLHVDDLIYGLIKSINAKFDNNWIILNLGSPQSVRISELAQKIIKITGSKSEIIHHKERRWDHINHRKPDLKKVVELINWSPKIFLEHGLVTYSEWFKKDFLNL